jgi:hypothetical protein
MKMKNSFSGVEVGIHFVQERKHKESFPSPYLDKKVIEYQTG